MQYGSSHRPRQDTLPNAIIQEDVLNWSSLHNVAANGDDKKLLILLAGNVDRSVRDSKHGNTPLHEAAWRGYSRCVKILCTPSHSKLDKKRKLKGQVLEIRGALQSTILGIQNNGGFTALHLAAQNGHNQSCRELLLAGADPDIQNFYGDTALHTACRYGHAGATRILLSASCDPNKANLNGDSPLHISSAMGRRKLTRILLEVDCDMTLKNAQEETARDIATRKHFREILDILNNPLRLQNKREKLKSNRKTTEKKTFQMSSSGIDCKKDISWSPYGCHYFPDSRSFPSPKLETLPKEPLKKGEQYYLDLAGHIRKGPIGIGNTCYCGPFFRHIEDKINSNRKSLRKYVSKAKESLGTKVQALANQTHDQIEQLTRSMIADRVRCENRRVDLDQWLNRGEPHRMTTENHLKSKRNHQNSDGTLTRCRSMDLLEENFQSNKLINSNSCGILEEATINVHQDCEYDNLEDQNNVAISEDQSLNFTVIEKNRLDGFSNVTERLGNILAKTSLILEIEKENRQTHLKNQDSYTDNSEILGNIKFNRNTATDSISDIKLDEQKEYKQMPQSITVLEEQTQLPPFPFCNKNVSQRHENLPPNIYFQHNFSGVSNLSQHSDCYENSKSLPNLPNDNQFQLLTNAKNNNNNESMLQSVISALQKDNQNVKAHMETKTLNESENSYDDKLCYKEEQTLLNISRSFQNSVLDEAATKLNENTNTLTTNTMILGIDCQSDQQLNKTLRPKKKIEIKNSEIKSLRKTNDVDFLKKGKVHKLVARLQEKLSSTHKFAQRKIGAPEISESESSEDDQKSHCQHRNMRDHNTSQTENIFSRINHSWAQSDRLDIMPQASEEFYEFFDKSKKNPSNIRPKSVIENIKYANCGSLQPFEIQGPIINRFIPKDAYFHDLPNRNRGNILDSNYIQLHHNIKETNENIPKCSNDDITNVNPILYPNIEMLHERQIQSSIHLMHDFFNENSTLPGKEKLLSNRKLNSPEIKKCVEFSDYEQYTTKCRKPTHQHSGKNVQKGLTPALRELLLVDRDISNDSGFSICSYSESHRPSPNESSKEGLRSSSNLIYLPNGNVPANVDASRRSQTGFSSIDNRDSLDAKFNVQSVSSLV